MTFNFCPSRFVELTQKLNRGVRSGLHMLKNRGGAFNNTQPVLRRTESANLSLI